MSFTCRCIVLQIPFVMGINIEEDVSTITNRGVSVLQILNPNLKKAK